MGRLCLGKTRQASIFALFLREPDAERASLRRMAKEFPQGLGIFGDVDEERQVLQGTDGRGGPQQGQQPAMPGQKGVLRQGR